MNDPRAEVFKALVTIIQEILINEKPGLEVVASSARLKRGPLSMGPETFLEVFARESRATV